MNVYAIINREQLAAKTGKKGFGHDHPVDEIDSVDFKRSFTQINIFFQACSRSTGNTLTAASGIGGNILRGPVRKSNGASPAMRNRLHELTIVNEPAIPS
jgi:hypothetical protein